MGRNIGFLDSVNPSLTEAHLLRRCRKYSLDYINLTSFLCICVAGHFLYTSPRTIPGSWTSLSSGSAGAAEQSCLLFSFSFSEAAGIQELVVKTGGQGQQDVTVWRMTPGDVYTGWVIAQVNTLMNAQE